MTAPFDANGVQGPSKVTRAEVFRALQSCDGDVSRAVDDILSLVAIKTMREQEQKTLEERRNNATLQLHELCSSLGLDNDSSFIAALQQLPAIERDDLLATDGAFVQQLLLSLEEGESNWEDGRCGGNGQVQVQVEVEGDDDVHPLQLLLELFPDYKVDMVEDVLDRYKYDVNKAAEALQHLQALDHVQSYATVVSADARAAARHRELVVNGPNVGSLGHFPALAIEGNNSVLKQQLKQQQRSRRQATIQVRLQERPPPKPLPLSIAFPTLPARKYVSEGNGVAANSAWNHHHRLESSITTQLKLERLKKLLPSVSNSVIHTTFILNGCSSDATEAALREVYNLPLAGKHVPPPPSVVEEMEMAAAAAEAEQIAAAKTSCKLRQGDQAEDWTLVSSKQKINAAREKLSNRYCDVLASFRRGQHVLASERIRELSKARREHREAQRQWAREYFLSHEEHLKHQRPIDLHGMIVMEALWVAREAIEYCQTHRIRRCLLICGVGHHSVNGKPRILTALQLSLNRRQIASRELHGVVTVFPLRSTDLS
uniref:Smr domain-containing protein n=1 Tax=Hyaloperonospora arabidopsidis (strain Emoy2) TaxID=559515 RepID=M4BPD3_HYAAE